MRALSASPVRGALLVVFLAAAARGQGLVAVGSEFQVSSSTSGDQFLPAMAMAASGSFVVVWEDHPVALPRSLRGRFFTAGGRPLAEEFQVSSGTASAPSGPPAVAMDAAGNAVVVWSGPASRSIQGRRLAARGAALGEEIRIDTDATRDETFPAVAMDADGDFVVVWQSDNFYGTDGDGSSVQGRSFSFDGQPLSGQFRVNSATRGDQGRPAVARTGDGGFVVVWSTDELTVQGRLLNAGGALRGGEFQVSTIVNEAYDLSVAATADEFLVVWSRDFQEIEGQRFAVDATPRGGAFRINALTPGNQGSPVVVADALGSWVVLWSSIQSGGTSLSVQARQLGPDGRFVGGDLQVNTVSGLGPAAAISPRGDLVVVWESAAPDDFSIRGRRFVVPPAPILSLHGGRFRVEVAWRDFQGRTGLGRIRLLNEVTGAFWFFSPDNLEVTVKVLDGRLVNGHYWVFLGSISNVEFTVTVTDTVSGLVKVYRNPIGRFASLGDTLAFPG